MRGYKMSYRKLSGWVFIYNELAGYWQATTRENARMLYNDSQNEKVLKSKNINTLFEIIIRTDGDKTKIKKLISSTKG